MIHIQNAKWVVVLAPISINATAATCTAVDTLGFNNATFVFVSGLIGAADFDSMSLTECETSGGVYSSAITGSAFTAPAQTDDGIIWVLDVKLQGRMRFLKPIIDPGAQDSLFACVCALTRANQTPNSVTERGVKQYLTI